MNEIDYDLNNTDGKPEIRITKYNGEELKDGHTSYFWIGGTNYSIGGTISVSFKIFNDGDNYLKMTGDPKVIISGGDSSLFSVLVDPPEYIKNGESDEFTVLYHPDENDTDYADLTIKNNDDDENEYTIKISGYGGGE